MTPNRRISITAGALFIVATAASLIGTALAPSPTGSDVLGQVASHPGAMATAQLLALVAAGCSVGIAIALHGVLRATHPTLALAAVVFRSIEAVRYATGAIAPADAAQHRHDDRPRGGGCSTLRSRGPADPRPVRRRHGGQRAVR